MADIAPPPSRGAAFGLRQSLDRIEPFTGPLIAIGLMFLWANDYRRVLWIAVIPGVLAVLLPAFGVNEPQHAAVSKGINPINQAGRRQLPDAYWWVVAVCAVFTLARFSTITSSGRWARIRKRFSGFLPRDPAADQVTPSAREPASPPGLRLPPLRRAW